MLIIMHCWHYVLFRSPQYVMILINGDNFYVYEVFKWCIMLCCSHGLPMMKSQMILIYCLSHIVVLMLLIRFMDVSFDDAYSTYVMFLTWWSIDLFLHSFATCPNLLQEKHLICFIFLIFQSMALCPNIFQEKQYPLKYSEVDDLSVRLLLAWNIILLQLATKCPKLWHIEHSKLLIRGKNRLTLL